ncbi:MAG: DUF6069 family protein [Chloroflexota bacterium]|nr:DUF6069 family protein [Chloroflexota bacterium]
MTAAVAAPQERIAPAARVWTIGVTAAVIASVINVIIYAIASALGVTFNISPAGMPPIPFAVIVVGATVIGVLVGTLVFTLMPRFTQRPVSLFRTVAIVVLILSLAQPLLLMTGMMPTPEPVTIGTIIALELMHIAAGATAIYLLTTRARA